MNTMIAKVIAFELGLLIAILTWMTFSGSSRTRMQRTAAADEPAEQSFATVSPGYRAQPVAVPAVDYLADEPATGLIEEAQPQVLQAYQPQEVAEPYYDSGYYDYAPPPDPSTYIGTYPEPVLGPDYYGWPYGGYGTYVPSTQIVIIRSPRSCGRRSMAMRHSSPPQMRPAPPHRRVQRSVPGAGRTITRRDPMPPRRMQPPRRAAAPRAVRPAQGIRTAWNR